MTPSGLFICVVLFSVAAPSALAQAVDPGPQAGALDAQQCQSLWATLDGNRDGMLTQAEIAAARDQMTEALRGRERLTEAEFLAACTGPVPAPKR